MSLIAISVFVTLICQIWFRMIGYYQGVNERL